MIAQHPIPTSVNSALQVDLFAQANASRIGSRVHSGFGGQTGFVVGAMHSPGGTRSSRCGRGTRRRTCRQW
jgi:acyl-CoA hydrolase